MATQPDIPPDVAAVFDRFQTAQRSRLLDLRTLILDTAAANPRIGPLVESLKWGEPAYRPARPRVGTTIRLTPPSQPNQPFRHGRPCVGHR